MANILIVEDEEKLARFVELELTHEGYSVGKASDGRTGLEMALSGKYDLCLLDIMLPELSGLDLGARDYITKPFAIEELLARIRAALRDAGSREAQSQLLICGRLTLDRARHIVQYDGTEIRLTGREFLLLETLMLNKTIVLSRETLMEKVWGYDYMGETNVVDVYIRFLRSKIDDVFGVKLIHTVRSVGYVIKEECV